MKGNKMKILSKRARERDSADFWKWTPEKAAHAAKFEEWLFPKPKPLAETIAIKRKEIETAVPELSNRFRLIRYLNWTDEDILENERLLKEELGA